MSDTMNAKQLKEVLTRALNDLESGRLSHQTASAKARLAREILRTVKTQLDVLAASRSNDDLKQFAEGE